jgi:hypothetical protein
MTSPEATENVVNDCIEAGIGCIWMSRATGKGSVSAKAVAVCRENAIQVVPGECPFMFLPDAVFVHRVHRLINQVTGHDPRRESSEPRNGEP